MKKITFLFILILASIILYSNDFLTSASNENTGITPAGAVYGNVVSATIDLGSSTDNITKVMVLASMNMKESGASTQGREVWYNIVNNRDANVSGEINRQVQAIDVDDYGVGTLVHIFDVSALSGDITYTLQHKNVRTGTGRNVETTGIITIVALNTENNNYVLNNSNKRIGAETETTTNISFTPVPGLTSDAVNIPLSGDIYVAASINCKETGGDNTVGEWGLEYMPDGGSWTSIGLPVKRTMSIAADDGIVSLVAIAKNLNAGDYYFRVSHRRISGAGTVATHYSNLIAVALVHSGSSYFPAFYQEVQAGVSSIGVSSTAELLTESFTTPSHIAGIGSGVLLHTQYLGEASNLNESINERIEAKHQLTLDDSTPPVTELSPRYRLLADNSDYGSGGFIGLQTDLDANQLHTVTLDHSIYAVQNTASPFDETLTSSNIILAGFLTYDIEHDNPLPVTLSSFSAAYINSASNLYWTTQSESSNLGWNVYKSETENFIEAGKQNFGLIQGAGTTSIPTEYSFTDPDQLTSGETYWYWLESISNCGDSEIFGPALLEVPIETPLPSITDLKSNYPNPFNPETTIEFMIEQDEKGILSIYNIKGQLIVEKEFGAGEYSYKWSANEYSSGIYFYKMKAGSFSSTKKMILLK